MLKKILTSLATFTLVVGAVTSATAWTNSNKVSSKPISNQEKQTQSNYNLSNDNFFTKNTSLPNNYSVTADYVYNNIVYVGTDEGLYESTDNGKTFVKNNALGNLYIGSIYAYNKIIYVGLGGLFAAGGDYGLYESMDNGQTFTENASINAIMHNPLYGGFYINRIYAANNVIYLWGTGEEPSTGREATYFYESFDNGKTFTPNSSLGPVFEVYTIYFYDSVVYLGSDDGIGLYESTDNGKTFTKNNTLQDYQTQIVYAFNNVVYVGTNGGLWESTDNGKTFSLDGSLGNYFEIESMFVFNKVFYVGINNDLTGDYGLYESMDNGQTFTENRFVSEADSFYAFQQRFICCWLETDFTNQRIMAKLSP